MKQYLVMSVLSQDRPGILQDLTAAVRDSGCNIAESRMIVLGKHLSMLVLVSGNWNALAKLEGLLPKLGKTHALTLSAHRTTERTPRHDLVPYAIDAVSLDRPDVLFKITSFFVARNISISELTSRGYLAAYTDAPMLSVQLSVSFPADLHIGGLREEFMDFCEQLNLDAVMEPIKN
ncbi:MAG: glycine cleavage system protein R [Gammaproteobacteria bacterium]|nr:glycine cleavage system protein R [Gammaproteobacteria bacterium]MDE2345786.1 glycine cleavage system protein R [Gammaproteobacteria bacterium]